MVYVIINKIIDKKEEKHYKHVKCQSHLPGQKNTDEVQSKYSALINLLFCYHIYMYIYLTKNSLIFGRLPKIDKILLQKRGKRYRRS